MPPALRQASWRPSVGGILAGAVAVTLGVTVVTVGVARWLPAARPAAVQAVAPHVIAGGRFEASGVAHVAGTNQLLFVDDGRPREIFVMELTSDGIQKGSAVPVPLAAEVTDPEGITSDGIHFYVIGSQSKKTGFEGDGLVRFTFDPRTRRADRVERIQGLKAWLAENVSELRGTERRVGNDALNIEGLAWDPGGRRLLLGLRSPIVDGQALVIPIKMTDPTASFSGENLEVDGATIRLRLNGAGIRSLEHDERTNTFRLIAGASPNDENREFRVVEWNGNPGSPLRDIARFSRRLKPEGITRAALDGRPVSVIVFDVGRFAVIGD